MTRKEKKCFSETSPFKRNVFIKTKPWRTLWLVKKKGWFFRILLIVVAVFYFFKGIIKNDLNYYHILFFSLPVSLLCFKSLKEVKKVNSNIFNFKKQDDSKKINN
jgi:hypothetical protein